MTPIRVLALLRGSDPGAARAVDPALDATAYALADDVDLTVVLIDRGVELAVAAPDVGGEIVAGVLVPSARPASDLVGLLDSGVRVWALAEHLAARGLTDADLLDRIEVVEEPDLARMMLDHDVTLTTTS